jgi:hypothetical protein
MRRQSIDSGKLARSRTIYDIDDSRLDSVNNVHNYDFIDTFRACHVSVQTTEQYLGCKQRLRDAVNDRIGLDLGASWPELLPVVD